MDEQATSSQQDSSHLEEAITDRLLTALEERWDVVADTFRRLRHVNHEMKEQLESQQEQIVDLQAVVARLEEENQGLKGEREQTAGRIEVLLEKFEELAQ